MTMSTTEIQNFPHEVQTLAIRHGATAEVLQLCDALQHDVDVLRLALNELSGGKMEDTLQADASSTHHTHHESQHRQYQPSSINGNVSSAATNYRDASDVIADALRVVATSSNRNEDPNDGEYTRQREQQRQFSSSVAALRSVSNMSTATTSTSPPPPHHHVAYHHPQSPVPPVQDTSSCAKARQHSSPFVGATTQQLSNIHHATTYDPYATQHASAARQRREPSEAWKSWLAADENAEPELLAVEQEDNRQLPVMYQTDTDSIRRNPHESLLAMRGAPLPGEDELLQRGASWVPKESIPVPAASPNVHVSVTPSKAHHIGRRSSFNMVEEDFSSSYQQTSSLTKINGALDYVPLGLPSHRYNLLQREVIPLAMKGKSIVAYGGRHSGRTTTTQILIETLTDFTQPNAQFYVVCSEDTYLKATQLLSYFISLKRVIVIHDGEYSHCPEKHLPQHETSLAPQMVIVLGNCEQIVPYSVMDVVHRSGTRQVLLLLDEETPTARELVSNAARAGQLSERSIARIAPRHVLRDAVVAAGGLGDYLVRINEENKYSGVQRLILQLFDRPFMILVAASRRKVERLSEALQATIPCVAAHYKSPTSIASANSAMKALAGERLSSAGGVNGTAGAVVRQTRLCIVCDANTVPSLELASMADLLCYYDLPAPATCIAHHRNAVLGRQSGEGGDSEALIVSFVATKEERLLALQQPGLSWIQLDL